MTGWLKSSLCASGECVEVSLTDDGAQMRDSKDRSSPVLRFTPGEWAAFLNGVRAGEFDLPAGAAQS